MYMYLQGFLDLIDFVVFNILGFINNMLYVIRKVPTKNQGVNILKNKVQHYS